MAAKNRLSFESFIFRINLILTGTIFICLEPTIRIYQKWFPDKTNTLWWIPLGFLCLSAFFWLLVSLNLDGMIRRGWIKDLRKNSRANEWDAWHRAQRISIPIFSAIFHSLLVTLIAIAVIHFLREGPFEKLFTNLPETKRFVKTAGF